jgi:hypothetical protein
VTEASEGHQLRVVATSADPDGGGTSATSAATSKALDPTPVIAVTVGGNAAVGQRLTATASATGDSDGGTTTFQWQSFNGTSWVNISRATSSTLTLAEANEGSPIRVVATFKDDTGQIVSTPSAATLTVADPPPALTLKSHSLTLPAGGSVSLGVSVRAADSDDVVSVTIRGLTSYESITDALDHQVFSGTPVTLTAAEVSSGLTLKSSYTGTDHPVNTLSLTASNTTNGEAATSAAQSITVTDPPTIAKGSQINDGNGASLSSIGTHDEGVVAPTLGQRLTLGTSSITSENIPSLKFDPQALLWSSDNGSREGFENGAPTDPLVSRLVSAISLFDVNSSALYGADVAWNSNLKPLGSAGVFPDSISAPVTGGHGEHLAASVYR